MPTVQGQLMAISAFVLVFFLLLARDKLKKADYKLSEIGSFLGGIISSIALLWVIYGQIKQTEILELNSKILQNQVEKLSPKIYIFFQHESIKFFKDYSELKKVTEKYSNEKIFNDSEKIILDYYKTYPDPLNKDKDSLKSEEIESTVKALTSFIFDLSSYKSGAHEIKITIKNSGAELNNLSLSTYARDVQISKIKAEKLNTENNIEVKILVPAETLLTLEKNIEISISGIDSNGFLKKYKIDIFINKEGREIQEKPFDYDSKVMRFIRSSFLVDYLDYKIHKIE